jgi:thiamine biosynthesis lipoprotein
MATSITVEAPSADIDRAAAIVFGIFRGIDAGMSEWKEASPLSRVNAAAGVEPVACLRELRELVGRAVEIAAMTDGAFDPTWAALWDLWDFNADRPRVPCADEVRARLGLIDYREVVIDEAHGTIWLPRPGMLLGLGAIAKGHALDRAAAELRAAGIPSFLLSAGGQVAVGAPRPGSSGWRIGIRDPRRQEDDCFARVDLENTSISTSGDYERFFVASGVRYHHILDPRTGFPSRGVRSASVICEDATLADGLSTALMVMGVEEGLRLVGRLPGVEAVMVDAAGRVHATSGLAERLRILHPPRRELPPG